MKYFVTINTWITSEDIEGIKAINKLSPYLVSPLYK